MFFFLPWSIFLKNVIVVHPFVLVVYVKYFYVHHLCELKKTTCTPTSGNHFDFVTYVSWKKQLVMRPQVCISFLFFYCISKKNHLWAHKCAISFVFFSYVSWKNHLQAYKCDIIFFSFLAWIKKTTCKLASVQCHFFHLHECLKITCKLTNV